MKPEQVHPSHDVREEGILISDPVCQICRASVHGSAERLLVECPGIIPKATQSLEKATCPFCGALPSDQCEDFRDMVNLLRETVATYGKAGGPWNVPSDPGGWLERNRAMLARVEEHLA